MAKREKPKSDLADKFLVRMPDGLRERIAFAAARNERPMNSEIVAALEKAFPAIPGWEDFLGDIDYVVSTYKNGDKGSRWTREELRMLMSTVAMQVRHDDPNRKPGDEGE